MAQAGGRSISLRNLAPEGLDAKTLSCQQEGATRADRTRIAPGMLRKARTDANTWLKEATRLKQVSLRA
jgi:hypothetical protein